MKDWSKGYIPQRVYMYRRGFRIRPSNYGAPEVYCDPGFPLAERTVNLKHKVVTVAENWASDGGAPILIDNVPKCGYRLVDVETRSEGARVWKVLTPDLYLVDMREDVFYPILFSSRVLHGGVIDAQLQWCQAGSQLRLEEVGTDQHKRYQPE